MLISYSREQATKSRELNLLDIVCFVNRCEAVLSTCQLTQECRRPPDGAILDQVAGGSVQLNTFQKIEPNLFGHFYTGELDPNTNRPNCQVELLSFGKALDHCLGSYMHAGHKDLHH